MKGQMLGSRSLEDDLSLAHSVHATSLQSDVSGRKGCGHVGLTHGCARHHCCQLMSFVLLEVGTDLTTVLLDGIAESPLDFRLLLSKMRWDQLML